MARATIYPLFPHTMLYRQSMGHADVAIYTTISHTQCRHIYGPGLSESVPMPESYCWEVWLGFIYTGSPKASWKYAPSSSSGSLLIK